MTKHILVSAGEVSGDIHAANLIKKLKELNPDLRFFGIGGKRMEEAGVELVLVVEADPVAEGALQVAEMELACDLHGGEDDFFL